MGIPPKAASILAQRLFRDAGRGSPSGFGQGGSARLHPDPRLPSGTTSTARSDTTKGVPVKMRVAASVVLAGLIVVGGSACEFITPQDTTKISQVADGMNAKVGSVSINDALMFTS